ncbi:DUF3142 domain-containing protein [Luteolibacter marinus]|uniref:DUF3142 domain-containing protein n=1 Tax=Luteolibacter marinus TaxID=2776705 RepID=UPI0018672363|nr:DUF3142 domain-containing protein [Luteolibacter marinus]
MLSIFASFRVISRWLTSSLSKRQLLAATLLALAACREQPAAVTADRTPAFWIWHRSSALSSAEQTRLDQAGSQRIYRQVGEFGWSDDGWSARAVCPAAVVAGSPDTIPVVRLDPGPAVMERADAAASLAKWIRFHFGEAVPDRLQIDHDCPARLLGRYAEFLSELRAELKLRELSVTALASWIESPALPRLGKATDELVPMFYDLSADPPRDIAAGKALPMAGDDGKRWIGRWKSCPAAWRAGLPNFERLSLFAGDGSLVGHLRDWSPETLAGSPVLVAVPGFAGGAAYRVKEDARYHGTALAAGQLLVWRAPDDAALVDLVRSSFDAGARGIVWFALPGPGLRAVHTPPHLAALARGEIPAPSLEAMRRDDGSVVLRNKGPGDLAIQPGAELHRLEITAGRPGAFSAAGPGEFAARQSALPVNFSKNIILTFTKLDVGSEIATEAGLVAGRTLHWSVDGAAPLPLP